MDLLNLISDALYYYFPLPKQDYVFEMAASTYVIVRSFRKNNYCLKLVVNKPTKPSLFFASNFFSIPNQLCLVYPETEVVKKWVKKYSY